MVQLVVSLALVYNVDIYSHGPSSLIHHNVFNVSVMML